MEKDPTITKLLESLKKNPSDSETFTNLEKYCILSNEWEALSLVYETRGNALGKNSPEEAAALFFKQGECHEKKLANTAAAIVSYEKAYRLSPEHKDYFDTLLRLQESTQDWAKVLDLLQESLGRSKSKTAKASILVRMASCHATRLDDMDKAKSFLQQAIKTDEQNQQAMEMLEKICIRDESWETLVELYQIQCTRASTSQEKIAKLHRCAQIYEEKLQYLPRAIEFYEETLKLAPADFQVLSSLESLFTLTENWERLVVIMESQLKCLKSDDDKIKLLTRLALVWSEKLKKLGNAVKCYERALEIKEDKMILEILEETYTFEKDWKNLARIYKKQANLSKNAKQKTALCCRLGELYEKELKVVEEAIVWYQNAFTQSPEELPILKKLQQLFESQGDLKNLLDAHRKELGFPLEKNEKIAIYERMARLLLDTDHPEEAAKIYEEVLSAYPEEKKIYASLRSVYEQLNATERLLDALVRESRLATEKEKVALYLEIAQILQNRLNQEAKAIEYYQKVLEIDGKNGEVLNLLKAYYAKQNAYPQLIETIFKIMDVNRFRIVPGYLEIARIQRDNLKDIPAAIASYNEVLRIAPQYLEAWKSLQELYRQQQAWDHYIRVCEKLLALVSDFSERLSLHYSLAEVYELKKSPSKREHHLQAVLQIKPDEIQAIEKLKEMYGQRQDWEKYVSILEKEARFVSFDFLTLSEKYAQIAQLYREKLGRIDKAIVCYEEARLCHPSNSEILSRLEELYETNKSYIPLVKALEEHARLLSPEESVEYYYKAGRVCEEEIKDIPKAIRLYRRVLVNAPDHFECMGKLEKLLKESRQAEKLMAFYNDHSKLIRDPEKRISMHLKAAQAAEEMTEEFGGAISHYQSVMKIRPDHLESMERLLELYRLEQQWDRLIEVYEQKMKLTSDKEEIVAILYEQASLYQNQLGWEEKAILCYEKILAMEGNHLKTILALEELCREKEKWEQLAYTLEKKIKLSQNPKTKKEIWAGLGELYRSKVVDPFKAVVCYEELAQVEPGVASHWKVLHTLYRDTNDFVKWAQAARKELEFVQEEPEKIVLLLELADLYESHLDKSEEAVEALERVLSIDPNHMGAFEALGRIYRRQQNQEALLEIWGRQIYVTDPESQKNLLLKMALLLEEKGDDEQSIHILEQALELSPDYKQGRDELAYLYAKKGAWEKLVHLYEEELGKCLDKKRQLWLYSALGQTYRKMGLDEKALEMYDCVLEIEPGNLLALKHIEEIYAGQEKLLELVGAIQKELTAGKIDPERRISLLLQSAEIQEFKLENCDGAKESYLSVHEISPKNLIAIKGLQRIYQHSKEYKALLAMLLKELELNQDPIRQSQIQLEIAFLQEEKFGETNTAIQYLLEVHGKKPDDVSVLIHLKNLWKKVENWPEYVKTIEKEVALLERKQDNLSLRRELMTVYDEKLNDFAKAIEHGQSILAENPNHLDTILHLQKLYGNTGDLSSLVKMYALEIEMIRAMGPENRLIHLYLESGKSYQQLGQEEQAVESFRKVIELEPKNSEALSHSVEILAHSNHWKELIEIYELAARLSQNKEEMENLHVKIAALWEKELDDESQALVHYQIAYQINPKNLAAVQGSIGILKKQERWGEAICMMEVEASLLEEKLRPSIYLMIGDIWADKLQVPHQAIRSYLRIMEHGFHRPTAEKVVKLQEKIGDWEGMASILEKDVRLTDLKSEELSQKLLQLSHLYWNKLHAIEDAVRVFKALLKLDKKNPQALDALEEILEQTQDWEELAGVVRDKLHSSQEEGKRFSLSYKLAGIFENHLHWGNYAIHYYEKALTIRPGDIQAIHALERVYERWAQFQKLVALYEKEIEVIQGDTEEYRDPQKALERTIHLYRSIGFLWERRLYDNVEAIRAYKKLMEIAPRDQAAAQCLSSLYRHCEKWNELIEILGVRVEHARNEDDIDGEVKLQIELGKLYQQLEKRQQAVEAFQRVLELEEFNEEAFACLEKQYERQSYFSNLVETLEDKSRVVTDPQAALNIQLKLSKLYEENMDQREKALECLNKAFAIDPENRTVLQSLHRIYQGKEDWNSLAEIAQKELGLSTEAEQKAELCFLLGMLNWEYFENPAKAKEYLSDGLKSLPSHTPSIMQLCEIAQKEENWEEAAHYMLEAIEYLKRPEETATIITRLGTLYREKMDLVPKAVEMYQTALRIDPENLESLEALADIHFGLAQWNEMEGILPRLISLLDEKATEKLACNYYRWGTTEEALGHHDQAISRYLSSLQQDEDYLPSLLALARIFKSKGQWQQVIQICEKAFSIEGLEEKEDLVYKMALAEEKLGHHERAIEYYEKLLPQRESDLEIIEPLARLHKETRNYHQSVVYFQKMVEMGVSEEKKFVALKEKASLLNLVGEYEESIKIYLALAEKEPDDLGIQLALINLYVQTKDWQQAQRWNQKNYEHLTEVKDKVENRCLYARILWEGMKKGELAVSAYKEAIRLEPASIKAIQGIAGIYLTDQNWKSLAESYSQFLNGLPEDKKKMGFPIHISLGNLLLDKLDDREGAMKEFEKALEIDPEHMEAQIALTELKSAIPTQREEAIKGHLMLLRRDQFRTASYRSLLHLFKEASSPDRALRTHRALSILDPVEKKENLFADKVSGRKISFSSSAEVAQGIVPSRILSLMELMTLTGEFQEKTYPPDLEKRFGLRKKAHLGAETVQRPIWYYANTIMKMLGITDMQMYINPQSTHQIFLENTEPPSLIISQALIDRFSEPELRFILAKYMFYIWQRQTLAYKLPVEELNVYFQLLKTCFIPVEEQFTPEAEKLQQKIKGSLPRKVKKILETKSELWESMQKISTKQYVKCLEYSSNRLALLVTDSLELSVKMVYLLSKLEEGETKSPHFPSLQEMAQVDGISDLLLFNMSEQYGKVRKICGLSIE